MAQLRILNANDVRQALPMAEAIAGMKEAFGQLSAGKATVPLRGRVDVPSHNGVSLFMPAYLASEDDLAVKIVSVYPDNIKRREPVIYATVIVLDAATGRPLALLEGGSLTAIRTGAGSGAATDLLARPDARIAAILGSGVQARTQLEAICTVRTITSVRIYSLDHAQAQEMARSLAGHGPIPENILVVANPQAAVSGADIVCTATTSRTPVFEGRDLKPGAHINAIGSFQAEVREVDSATIRRSLIVIDSREAALAEAGDLIIPLKAGEIDDSHIHAELGEIINGQKSGRSDDQQITFYKSVGVAVQDAVAGRIALRNAAAKNLGVIVNL